MSKLTLEERITRLEKMIKNEGTYWKAVPDSEIPDYIKKLYTKKLKDYFDNYIFNKDKDLSTKRFVEFLEKTKGEMPSIMGTVMSSVIHSGKIKNGDDGLCNRLFMDITKNPKPKTAFLKELCTNYLFHTNAIIASTGYNGNKSDSYELASEVEQWFDDNMAPRQYDDEKEWLGDLRYMAKGRPNGSAIDDCMDEIEAPEEDYDKVRKTLAELAKNAIDEHKENKRRGYDGNGAWRTDHFN